MGGGRGHQQHVNVVPHFGGLLAISVQLGLRLEQVGGTVLAPLGNDAAHRLDHLVLMRVKKRPDGRITLGDQRAFIQQRGALRQRCVVNAHRHTAQGAQPFDRLVKRRLRLRVAKEFQHRRHTETKRCAPSLAA